jgi:Fe-S-cluster containining protein
MPPYDIPADARFTCQQCAGCCHRWHVYLTQEEQHRIMAHDWAAESPRLVGQKLYEEFPAPGRRGERAVRLARIDGACVFMEPDNLCLIHKVQGMEAKPGPCQQYPYHFADTPEGVAVALDFACSSVLADDGAPLASEMADVEGAYRASRGRAEVLAQIGLPAQGALGEGLLLQRGQPLHWRNYRVLEGALLAALLQPVPSLEQRLLALDRLLRETAERYGAHLAQPSEALAAWAAELATADYAPLLAETPPTGLSPMRQRAVLAPFLGSLEQQWQTWGAGGGGLGTRLTLAIIIANGVGPLPLSSFEATVDQGQMNRTRFPQDDPQLSHLFTRYLKGLLQRKSLIEGTDVLQGFRYLLLSFAAARWYAVARATLAGRATAEIDDLRQGIRVVEKGLGHAVGLRTGATQRVVSFLFSRVASPATVIHNFYTG